VPVLLFPKGNFRANLQNDKIKMFCLGHLQQSPAFSSISGDLSGEKKDTGIG
jgi:hypothetical protein